MTMNPNTSRRKLDAFDLNLVLGEIVKHISDHLSSARVQIWHVPDAEHLFIVVNTGILEHSSEEHLLDNDLQKSRAACFFAR